MQELDDKQRGDLGLDDGQEEELVSVDGDQVVVGGLQDWGHILRLHRLLLGLEEVVAHGPADDALPVFLQEDVSRLIHQEQTVDHLSCNKEASVSALASTRNITSALLFWTSALISHESAHIPQQHTASVIDVSHLAPVNLEK